MDAQEYDSSPRILKSVCSHLVTGSPSHLLDRLSFSSAAMKLTGSEIETKKTGSTGSLTVVFFLLAAECQILLHKSLVETRQDERRSP
jgi:hypothetical protein